MNNENTFYVYEWFIVDTLEIFYVGKGKNLRRFETKHRNNYFKNIINKHNCSVRIVESQLTEEEAFELECDRIAELKAINQSKANIHDGGCGGDTYSNRPEELNKITREKISKNTTGCNNPMYGKKGAFYNKKRPDHSNKLKDLWRDNEFRNKMKSRKSTRGIPKSEQTKQNMKKNHADFSNGKNPRAKTTYLYENNKLISQFSTIKEAGEFYYLNYNIKSVTTATNLVKKSCKNNITYENGVRFSNHKDNFVY